MRRISAICFALFVIAGCGGAAGDSGKPTGNQGAQPSSQQTTPVTTGATQAACGDPCEGPPVMMMKKINGQGWTNLNLTQKETNELKQALKDTPMISPADTLHIHADAPSGQLVFSAEKVQDPTHLTGKEPEVAIGTSVPVKLVATPAAMKLLEQKSTR